MGRKPKIVATRDIAVEEDGVRRTGRYIEYDDGTVTVISDEGRENSTQIGNSDVETVAKMKLRLLVSDFRTTRIKPLHPPADEK
jgi:hypothetical protein